MAGQAQVSGVQYLCMFDTVATIAGDRVRRSYALEKLQGFPVAGVADCVDTDLKACRHHGSGQFAVKSVAHTTHAPMSGFVTVVAQ